MSFEYAVRPFQSPDVHGRTIVPSTPAGVERATLTWGSKQAASGAALPKPKSIGVNIECCDEAITEQSRVGDTIKIPASNDPEYYVMVDRAREVKLKKKETNKCEDSMNSYSYVAAGVTSSFADMAANIHASDAAFLPSFGQAECHQTLKLQGNTTAS